MVDLVNDLLSLENIGRRSQLRRSDEPCQRNRRRRWQLLSELLSNPLELAELIRVEKISGESNTGEACTGPRGCIERFRASEKHKLFCRAIVCTIQPHVGICRYADSEKLLSEQ